MTTWAYAQEKIQPSLVFDVDKSTWPDGPWKFEPDSATWYDFYTGLKCHITRNESFGSLLGYVQVPWWLPNDLPGWDEASNAFVVHGGVTFIGHLFLEKKGEPGSKWIGFDCAHGFDLTPAVIAGMLQAVMDNIFNATPPDITSQYRTWEYVMTQVTELAGQVLSHYTQKVLA